MSANKIIISILLLGLAIPNYSFGQKGKILKETVEFLFGKFGKEAAEIGAESLTKKLGSLSTKYGDDVFDAVRKVGPRSIRFIEEAGEHGLDAVKLMAKYGDDAVWVVAKKNRLGIFVKYGDDAAEGMIKHGEIAEPLLTTFGKPAASALKVVDPQNGRRLAMLADSGELAKIGRTQEILETIAKYGDRAAKFIWENKGALTIATALTAFLSNPQPFIDGVLKLPVDVANQAARNTNWTAIGLVSIVVIGLFFGFRLWLQPRHAAISQQPAKPAEPNTSGQSVPPNPS